MMNNHKEVKSPRRQNKLEVYKFNRVSKYIRQTMIGLKGEIYKSIIIVVNFSTSLSVIDT